MPSPNSFPRHRVLASRRVLLGLALATPAALAGAIEPDDERRRATTLDTLQVTGLRERADRVAAAHDVISSEHIVESDAATLGDALDGRPGIHADTFGAGAARPVIRGQTAPRVKVLSDSSAVIDASDISPDHAVTVDPLLGGRVEVLRGPATLLYGGGAIGGVVNVLDEKVPTALPENGIDGRVAVRGNSVARERAAGGQASFSLGGGWVGHAEASSIDRDDYRSPAAPGGRVEDTFARSRNASAGLSWVGGRGYLGLAYSWRDDDYALPGHHHEYEDCHPHGAHLHCGGHAHDHAGAGDDHDHPGHEDDHGATIALRSRRLDLRGEVSDPLPGIAAIRLRANHTDYRHDELDGGVVGTTFANNGHDSRIEFVHRPLGRLDGIFGVQHADTRFSALGEEAFMPKVDTVSTGVFLVEHFELDDRWHFEAGARYDRLSHTPRDDERQRPAFGDSATSFSAAAIWSLQPDLSLVFSASRSQRLPHAQELYARGIHLATNTYECGLLPQPLTCGGLRNNQPYGRETARNLELALRRTAGALTFSLGAYRNRIDHYIHARTLDQFEDFRLIKYSQADVEFRGFEAELDYQLTEALSVGAFADAVDARLRAGGYLPRIPASRIGARARWQRGPLEADLEFRRVNPQRDIADFESPTQGYDMLDLGVAYAFADGRTRIFFQGRNLLDDKAWNHASFLAHTVPLPGRNLSAGLSYRF